MQKISAERVHSEPPSHHSITSSARAMRGWQLDTQSLSGRKVIASSTLPARETIAGIVAKHKVPAIYWTGQLDRVSSLKDAVDVSGGSIENISTIEPVSNKAAAPHESRG
jgi:hypothetical protein